MNVLIAEDDSVSRRLLEAMVRRWGYEVTAVADGEEAWAGIQRHPPDIALLDWEMPSLSGPDLCRRVRDTHTEDYVYLILLTARTAPRDTVAGLNAGADDYITKPPALRELRARLRVGQRVVRLHRDLQQVNRKLARLAATDELTGLSNRRAILERFADELARAQRHGEPLAAVLADIDHFKRINDRHGHQAGDAVLTELAKRLRSAVRRYDLVGRYGGEEFLIVLPGADVSSACAITERIRQRIAGVPFELPSASPLSVTVSLGIAQATGGDGDTIDRIISLADDALRHAKEGGRDQLCVAAPSFSPRSR